MPQMSPLSWLTLMLIFILTFKIFNCINYFLFIQQPKIKMNEKKTKMYNWKW
uniref:ATP synthase complex subunit 8 n=1 Tax=Spiniphilus spinicornis TaxID=1799505 RepID=A0A140CVL7_9CUCU|nr:ATP synthase F0 subunit 8 [Spiniphilus spinicornis]AMJ17341.1 ATP synthase F0 subunit 8 [Spiniphilus spinicornis]QVM79143.1 ATP synthase F0 subunit 8 [Spiniphilus spinicornis]